MNIKQEPMEIDLTGQVAEAASVDRSLVCRVVPMLEEGFTVPFIARYRKEVTGGAEPSVLHRLKEKLADCKLLNDKIEKSYQFLKKTGNLNENLHQQLLHCRNVSDVKLLLDPFKSKLPRTLAGRARAAKLEPIALSILHNKRYIDISREAPLEAKKIFMQKNSLNEAVAHIIADIISKDIDVLHFVENMCIKISPMLVTSKKIHRSGTRSGEPISIDSDDDQKSGGSSLLKKCVKKESNATQHNISKRNDDLVTFRRYLNFSSPANRLLAHQVLAINRAADREVISIKFEFPPNLKQSCYQYIYMKYTAQVHKGHLNFVSDAIWDSWKRLIEPYLIRHIRFKLTTSSQDTSLDIFASNLRRMLMTAPLRASDTSHNQKRLTSPLVAPGDRLPVVGLDPGYKHGCKWAACDAHGAVLDFGVIWPPHITHHSMQTKRTKPEFLSESSVDGGNDFNLPLLTKTMRCHNIEIIALGNGCGSREIGCWLAQLIKSKHFEPLNVQFAVVNEAGASHYSASAFASKELPSLDVTFRGAVSIARRLQDPLAEMVKVEPKHLGVGMYQHDLPTNRLTSAVNNVMEECISFVGVDVNCAPMHVLSRVAGLTEAKAKLIMDYRSNVGAIRSRSELLKIKGIGRATFAQCAGFIRVRPAYSTVQSNGFNDVEMISISSDDDDVQLIDPPKTGAKRKNSGKQVTGRKKSRLTKSHEEDEHNTYNPLDQTAVHPDSYDVATNLLVSLKCTLQDVGTSKLRSAASNLLQDSKCDEKLSQFCTDIIGLDTMRDILQALSRALDFDEREDCFCPLFHSSVMRMSDLKPGMRITGRVENVTTFGAFCDIGVEVSGYVARRNYPIHTGQSNAPFNGTKSLFSLGLGDRINARVAECDTHTGQIRLDDVHIIRG